MYIQVVCPKCLSIRTVSDYEAFVHCGNCRVIFSIIDAKKHK